MAEQKEQKSPGEEPDVARAADAGKAQSAPEAEDAEAGEQDERLSGLEAELESAMARAEENWNQFLRARAELENVRRRLERDVEHAHKFGLEKIAADLLPVKDSLEMGLQAATEDGANVERLTEGSELTLKMLAQVLDRFSIVEIDPKGQKFDPEKHEAMAMQPSAEHEPNTVIHVVQKGYTLNDRLLRPAMVIVSRAAEEESGKP
ncbi:MAG: nucleotide exchange factor GrpE [Aquisalimonadaceae bacterium]